MKPSEQQVLDAIDEILSRREFGGTGEQRQETAVAEREWTPPQVREPSGGGGSFSLPVLVIILVVGAVLLAAAVVILRGERGKRIVRERPQEGEGPRDLLQAVSDLAAKGDYAQALVQLFALHLQGLGGSGWIAIEKSKTNLQYELELMQGGYPDLDNFRRFKQAFHGVRFGGRGMDADAFARWFGYCRQPLQGRWTA